ncbi:BSD-like protein [Tanacetum coccineum]
MKLKEKSMVNLTIDDVDHVVGVCPLRNWMNFKFGDWILKFLSVCVRHSSSRKKGILGGNWSWRVPPRGRAIDELSSLISLIGNLSLDSNGTDKWIWSGDASGGRFRSGIEKLSNNIDVSEITKLATNLLQLSPEDEEVVKAVGVTEEVVAFVRDITLHPETWLDFPLPDDHDDDNQDFELSDAQQEHALTVESLAPRLAALRIELCPGYMSESSFWKIYFVLLHPRLEPHAAEILSTPEIVKARASLTHELKSRSNPQPKKEEGSSNVFPYSDAPQEEHSSEPESAPLEIITTPSTTSAVSADVETEKRSISSEDVQIVDKSVIQEEPRNETKSGDHNMSFKTVIEDKDDDDADDWLKEDNSENITGTGTTTIPIENDEDVSFSDLEEDDADAPTNYKNGSDSSTKDSRDWVQLGSGPGQASGQNSETKETNDWLDVDDIDVA